MANNGNNGGCMMLKLQVIINVHTKVIYKFNIREDEIIQGIMTGDYGIALSTNCKESIIRT